MKLFTKYTVILLLLLSLLSCNNPATPTPPPQTQNTKTVVGGGCDGCELMYAGMPERITAVDTSAGWQEHPERRLVVKGTVFKKDGTTPAPDVVIYYWQTDANGLYSPGKGLHKDAERHGHIRGWIKSGADGKYTLYTSRPAPYPDDTMPAHIHTSIKEPDVANEYYIDEFVFNDDPLLTSAKRNAMELRGGSGILFTETVKGVQWAKHDIVLGMNVY